jgi:hypothetical protein
MAVGTALIVIFVASLLLFTHVGRLVLGGLALLLLCGVLWVATQGQTNVKAEAACAGVTLRDECLKNHGASYLF